MEKPEKLKTLLVEVNRVIDTLDRHRKNENTDAIKIEQTTAELAGIIKYLTSYPEDELNAHKEDLFALRARVDQLHSKITDSQKDNRKKISDLHKRSKAQKSYTKKD